MRARDGAARRQRDAGTLAHLCMSGKGAQDGGTKQRFSSLGLLCRRRGAPSLRPSLPSSLPPSVCYISPIGGSPGILKGAAIHPKKVSCEGCLAQSKAPRSGWSPPLLLSLQGPCKAPDERLRHSLRKDDSTILPTASCSRTDRLADTAQRM